MKPIKKHNNYAFIDSQNLNLGVKSQGWELDWRKFRQFLRNKYAVTTAYLFIGYIPHNKDLYTFLEKTGFTLIYKPVIESKHAKVKPKGNVDAELVLHTMIQYNNFTKAIIVSGDGDFFCLAEYLKSQRKLLKIITPTKHYSSLLRTFNRGNYIVRIDLLRKSLEQKKRLAFAVGRNLRLVQSS